MTPLLELTDDTFEAHTNFCTDLVSQRKWEPVLAALFREHEAGNWVTLSQLLGELGLVGDVALPDCLVVAWIRTPDPDYRILTFFDTETKWFLHAGYNFERLRRTLSQQPVNLATPDTFGATSTHSEPVGGRKYHSLRRTGRSTRLPRGERQRNRVRRVA